MLTPEQREEFDKRGIVRLSAAIASAVAKEMCDCVWDCLRKRYNIRSDAPGTWGDPPVRGAQQITGVQRFTGTRHLPKSVTFAQIGSPVVTGALDDLIGVGNWQRPERWGSLLVTFPESRDSWDVPSHGWHLDLPASRSPSGLFAVRLFTCLAKLSPGGGGTVFVTGSHRLVEELVRKGPVDRLPSAEARKSLIRAYPWVKALCSWDEKSDRVHRFMSLGTIIDGVEVRVVEMTGEPGDVFVTYPLMLHAPSVNCSSAPRMVLSTTVYRSGVVPIKLYR